MPMATKSTSKLNMEMGLIIRETDGAAALDSATPIRENAIGTIDPKLTNCAGFAIAGLIRSKFLKILSPCNR